MHLSHDKLALGQEQAVHALAHARRLAGPEPARARCNAYLALARAFALARAEAEACWDGRAPQGGDYAVAYLEALTAGAALLQHLREQGVLALEKGMDESPELA